MWETLPCNVTALVASCNSTVTTATLEWDDFAIEFKFNAVSIVMFKCQS